MGSFVFKNSLSSVCGGRAVTGGQRKPLGRGMKVLSLEFRLACTDGEGHGDTAGHQQCLQQSTPGPTQIHSWPMMSLPCSVIDFSNLYLVRTQENKTILNPQINYQKRITGTNYRPHFYS